MEHLAILKITDGTSTNTINLLNRRKGYLLCDWKPSVPQFNYVFNKQYFSGLDIPASVMESSVIESFTFKNRASDIDGLYELEQKLRRFLSWSAQYWIGNPVVKRPFYIVAKNKYETYERYGTILYAQLHPSDNPYANPVMSRNPATNNLVVPITHAGWKEYPPDGSGNDMFGGVFSGIDSPITDKNHSMQLIEYEDKNCMPVLSNFLSKTNITHMFRGNEWWNSIFSKETDVFSGIEVFSPSDVSSYTYFGIESKGGSLGQTIATNIFNGIHLNITNPARQGLLTHDPTFTWEAYTTRNGGEWTELSIKDTTNGLTKPGVVLFNILGWYTLKETPINSVWGYWVRVQTDRLLTNNPDFSITYPCILTVPYFDLLFSGDGSDVGYPDSVPTSVHIEDTPETGKYPYFLKYSVTQDASPLVPVPAPLFDLYFDFTETDNYANELFSIAFKDPDGSWNFYDDKRDLYYYFYNEGYWQLQCEYVVSEPPSSGGPVATGPAYMIINGIWETISPYKKIAPDFSVDQQSGIAGYTVINFDSARSFDDLESDAIWKVRWDFGDGTVVEDLIGYVADIDHTYDNPGYYTVEMTLITSGGIEVSVRKGKCIYIYNDAVALFTADAKRGLAPLTVKFDASASYTTATNITNFDWEFGDGSSGVGEQITHIYSDPGLYSVTLTVTDNALNESTLVKQSYIYVDPGLIYPGDNGAELLFSLEPVEKDWNLEFSGYPNKIYLGAKILTSERDRLFSSYFPIGDDTISGVSFQPVDRMYIEGSAYSYSGKCLKIAYGDGPDRGEDTLCATIAFNNDYVDVYKGTYKLFMRVRYNSTPELDVGKVFWSAGVTSEFSTSKNIQNASGINRTRWVSDVLHNMYITSIELGSITIGERDGIKQLLNIYWKLFTNPEQTTQILAENIQILDFVIIPQDVWYCQINTPRDVEGGWRKIVISSLTPSGELSVHGEDSNGIIRWVPSTIPGRPLSILGRDTRFTIYSSKYVEDNTDYDGSVFPHNTSSFTRYYTLSEVKKRNKFYGSRGGI